MALFIGDHTKSPTTTVSANICPMPDDNTSEVIITVSDPDRHELKFVAATVDSTVVANNMRASIDKAAAECNKDNWISLRYFEKGHQVVVYPDRCSERVQYTVPLDIRSISNEILTADDPVFRYVKDVIIIVTDAEDPVRFTIDPRNTVSTVSMMLDPESLDVTNGKCGKKYKIYMILVKYNNWSKLKYPAHIVIHDKSGSRDLKSYILGSTTVEFGRKHYTMNALLKDECPEEKLRLLEETLRREKDRAAARQNKSKEHTNDNDQLNRSKPTKNKDGKNKTLRPKRRR